MIQTKQRASATLSYTNLPEIGNQATNSAHRDKVSGNRTRLVAQYKVPWYCRAASPVGGSVELRSVQITAR